MVHSLIYMPLSILFIHNTQTIEILNNLPRPQAPPNFSMYDAENNVGLGGKITRV